MSELPKIEDSAVTSSLASKLASTNFDLMHQVSKLELLATELRNERDAARGELSSTQAETKELKLQIKILQEGIPAEKEVAPGEVKNEE